MGRDPTPNRLGTPAASGTPEPPPWLAGDALAVWRRILATAPARAITGADEGILAAAAAELTQYLRLAEHIASQPTDGGVSADAARTRRAAALHLQSFMHASRALGLSPVDRARLAEQCEPDPLAEVLSKKPDLNIAPQGDGSLWQPRPVNEQSGDENSRFSDSEPGRAVTAPPPGGYV